MTDNLDQTLGSSTKGANATATSKNYYPFQNLQIKTYSHTSNIVPPYVLDKLSQVHYKEQLNNTNTNVATSSSTLPTHYIHNHNQRPHSVHSKAQSHKSDGISEEFYSFANDPFVKSIGGNWQTFLNTVQQPNGYTHGVTEYDAKFNSDWNLDGNWGGEKRLKHELLGTSPQDEDESRRMPELSWFARVFNPFSSKSKQYNRRRITSSQSTLTVNKEINEPSPKVRSKAGYWMSDEKRADLMPTLQRVFLQNPLIPLLLRIVIIILSVLSLLLAVLIFVLSNTQAEKVTEQPSTIMAIIVQCFAIIYLTYIAYDEYHGKPLGLRDPIQKIKLILLDMLFIIMSLANLSLTFNTLYDPQWVCTEIPQEDPYSSETSLGVFYGYFYPMIGSLCRRQRALLGFLLVALFLWVLTFIISIIRVVDRVSSNPRID